jgi:CheY-like chemotaxis protein
MPSTLSQSSPDDNDNNNINLDAGVDVEPATANSDKLGLSKAARSALRILVAEDNQNLKDIVCDMLGIMGYVVYGALDAKQALAIAEQHTVDILLSDISLPGMSGIELARQLLQKQAQVKIVFASGYDAPMLKEVKFPHRILTKPYDLQQIQQVFDELFLLP